MGGHEAGDFASASIVTALSAIDPAPDLGDLVDAAAAELDAVDAALRARAAMLGPAAVIASTVVVLLANAGEFACLWAGDSRLYRWRPMGQDPSGQGHLGQDRREFRAAAGGGASPPVLEYRDPLDRRRPSRIRPAAGRGMAGGPVPAVQ
jgi:hypothetical protein